MIVCRSCKIYSLNRVSRISSISNFWIGNRFTSSTSSSNHKRRAGPIEVYNESVARKLIKFDQHQHKVIVQLDRLHHSILEFEANPYITRQELVKTVQATATVKGKSAGTFQKYVGVLNEDGVVDDGSMRQVTSSGPPKGLYLWGGTGSGKTFMMDMFFENLPTKPNSKKRIHFHNFMLEVHKMLFLLKSRDKRLHSDDLMAKVVDEMLQGAYVICFDEFQVTDIADAMIIKSLFSTLFQKGITLIATSNRPPSDLYRNGLQRSLFVPFIDLLEQYTKVHSIKESSVDYRLIKSEQQAKNAYLFPLNAENNANIESQFLQYRIRSNTSVPSSSTSSSTTTGNSENPGIRSDSNDLLPIKSMQLMVYGHQLICPDVIVGRKIAKFSFNSLCDNALGVVDYIELAKVFKVVFLTDIPKLNLTSRNQMRRLISLIDAFYEGQVHLITTAAAGPTDLLDLSSEEKASCAFDEIFAFDRTVSRLLEMRSTEYIARVTSSHGVDFIDSLVNDRTITNADGMMKEIWISYSYSCESIEGKIADTIAMDDAIVLLSDILQYISNKQPHLADNITNIIGYKLDLTNISQYLNSKASCNSGRLTIDDIGLAIRPILGLLKNN